MALTLDEIKHYIPSLQDKPVDEIVRVLEENGIDTSGINVEPKEEAGLLKSYVGIPLAKGVSGIRGAIGYGLEASGIAPETGREMQAAQEAYAQELTAEQSQQAREDAAKTLIDENGNYGGYNLGTATQQLFESAPSTAAMALPGGLLAKGASVGLKAAGVGAKAAELIGSGLGFGAAEGGISGAQNAAQIQQEIRNADISVLSKHPEFIKTVNEFTDQSLPIEERENIAREILARRAGDQVFADTFVKTGGISAATGGGFVGGIFRGGQTGNILARVAKSGGQEFLQEAPQSAFEQQTLNQAKQDYLNKAQDVNQGVLTAGLEGGIVGFAMGGVGGIAKAKSVDEAIDESDKALSWNPPEYKVVPDAEKIVQNRTIPGQGVQDFIDSQYQDTGYVPKTIWESPNVKEIQDQIERNKTFGQIENQAKAEKEQAFFQAEQDAIQQKQNELEEMELNPDASKQDIKKFRKARIDLQLQKRKNAELFRQGLGFEIIPFQSGNVENDQLRFKLKQAIGQQRERLPDEKLPEDKKLSEDTGTYEPQNQLDTNDQDRVSAEVLPGELPPLADDLAYEKETTKRSNQTPPGREELSSNVDTGEGGRIDDGGIDSVSSGLPIGKQLSYRTDLPSATSELPELKETSPKHAPNRKYDWAMTKQEFVENRLEWAEKQLDSLTNNKQNRSWTTSNYVGNSVRSIQTVDDKRKEDIAYYKDFIKKLKQGDDEGIHKDIIKRAKSLNYYVPPEVLKDYPDLQNVAQKEPTTDTKTQQETQEPNQSESRVVAPSAEKVVDAGTYVYHATNQDIESIKNNGLMLKKDRTSGRTIERIHVSLNESDADKWANALKKKTQLRFKPKASLEEGAYDTTKKYTSDVKPWDIEIKTPDGWIPLVEDKIKQPRTWHELGSLVNQYLPIDASFNKPKPEHIKIVADRLGISQIDVRRAKTAYDLDYYENVKNKQVPTIKGTLSGETKIADAGMEAKESISEPKEKRINRLDDSAFKETMIDIDEGGQLSADKVLDHVREKIKSYQAFIDCVRTS